uniref:Uncharacterized protein n=1 Tax=Globodera rostochiensis TaxID=31243 RepID=A0A914GVI7_GLORO
MPLITGTSIPTLPGGVVGLAAEGKIITTLTLRNQQQVIIRRMREEDINEAGEIIRASYLDDCKNIEHATSEERCQMFTVPVERTRRMATG